MKLEDACDALDKRVDYLDLIGVAALKVVLGYVRTKMRQEAKKDAL